MNFTIKTIGCKVNTYESAKIKDELIKLGFNYIDVEEKEKYSKLDFYIVNTCSVTKIADKKSRQMLHLAKKYNPKVKVIAIGCMVDSLSVGASNNVGAKLCEPTNVDSVGASSASPLAGVDYVISNKEKSRFTELLLSFLGVDNVEAKNNVGAKLCEPEVVWASCASPSRIRAFIKIQDGCNQYCTYCIIPFLRGNIKSRDNDDIIKEIKEKVESGVKEIVLTGIHLSSFGLDRVNKTYESEGAIDIARTSLLEIMNEIANIDGVERIRLGSLEPRIISDDFLSAIVGADIIRQAVGANPAIVGATHREPAFVGAKHCEPEVVRASYASPLSIKFCANFCLSLQSGCDKTLKRMNRHYTTSDFENACNLIRKYMPYATITTDVIVGFPGESEDDFKESLEFVKRMRFYNPNIFPYSRRQGTKADLMPDQLTNDEKHRRSVIMIADCEKISKEIEQEYFKNYKDKAKDILIEEYVEENGKKYGIGYTREYVKCRAST